jgi:MFS family permease
MKRLAEAGTFRSFRHENFRRYFVSQAFSAVGTWLQLVAQTVLILQLTDSGMALGLLMTFQYAPSLVFGAWAGVLLDRSDKRKVIATTTVVMCLAALCLGTTVLTGHVSVAMVYAVGMVLGVANAFDAPGRRALVNELVAPADVNNAVNLYATLFTGARLLGPAIAGVLVATVGIGWCFILNAASFVAPLTALYRMNMSTLHAAPPMVREPRQLRDGLRYAASIDELRLPLVLLATMGVLGFNFQVHLPLLATDGLGGGDGSYTALSGAFGLGSLVGALWLASRRSVTNRFVGLAGVTLGAASGALSLAPTLAAALPIATVVGVASIAVMAGCNTVIAVNAVPQMRGRMAALYTMVALGALPIGGPIAGSIAELAGARTGLLIAAAMSGLAGLAVVVRSRRVEQHRSVALNA